MAKRIDRRAFLKTSTGVLGAGMVAQAAKADVPAGRDPFEYEITRTDEEWMEMLGEHDFEILRGGRTEQQRSSPLWSETRSGKYLCRGCDLENYSSFTKAYPGKGWVFFTASEPNSQMMAQDSGAEMADEASDITIEVHCRRCGSHTGHILLVNGQVLHCINGASLTFVPDEA